ncbi:MAG: heme-dependent oxidative N-demethylase subunit alpha family protein, partial [Pseudomonadota bacterium]
MWVDPDLINEPLDPLPWEKPRFSTIPGTDPLAPDDWLRVSDTFEGQMQERARLIRERPGDVIAKTATSTAAVEELFDATLDILRTRAGYDVSSDSVTRPDGVEVRISDPLCTL